MNLLKMVCDSQMMESKEVHPSWETGMFLGEVVMTEHEGNKASKDILEGGASHQANAYE